MLLTHTVWPFPLGQERGSGVAADFSRSHQTGSKLRHAYGGQATVYHNLGESDLARENAAKAYELRSRVTESERATIDARYYSM